MALKTVVLNKPALAAWKGAETGKMNIELAHELEIHPVTLSAWLNGHSSPDLAAAFKLAKITGLAALKLGKLVREVA